MQDLLDDFIAETRETLQAIEGELIAWERDPGNRQLLDSIFRFVHTVKGSCGFLDLTRLTRLSHSAEDALDAVRQDKLVASRPLVSAVLAIIDRIMAVTNALESDGAVPDDDGELIETLNAVCQGKAAVPVPLPAAVALPDASNEQRERRTERRPGSNRNRSARLSLDLLDNLMNGVSDMVLARNEMARRLREEGVGVEIEQLFSRLSSSIAEMRDSIGLVRLQPIERLFVSFPRLVRDIAADLRKDIVLEIEGSDVEIDREMVELVRDPIMHILRNAADHGIETRQERLDAGKPSRAVISLSAQQAGNQIVIEVSDDGRGIDPEALSAKAIAKGITTAEQVAMMSSRDVLELILQPGFSTAQSVTDLSGRGVGMDIVRHAIEQMGGTIELYNNPGHGLSVTLRLPLTLSIMAGLILRSGEMLFAIPRSAVVEILSIRGGQVRIDAAGGTEIANIRGEKMSHVQLAKVLGIDAADGKTVIVVRADSGRRYALSVEAVIDHEELVVKPAPPLLMASGVYAGLSLPDSGRPIMLLDAAGIAETARISDRFSRAVPDHKLLQAKPAARALLFMCLTGKRKAIRLSVLDRMEEVPSATIREIGGAMRLSYKGRRGVVLGHQGEPTGEAAKLLRLTDGQQDVYIIVDDMLDIIDITNRVSVTGTPMVEAVIEHDGEQIELIDAHAFLAEGARLSSQIDGADGPLCYLEADSQGWMRNVLRPLIEAAGYRVTQDPAERADAVTELLAGDGGGGAIDPDRTILLSDQPGASNDGSVYRYDRTAILGALAARHDQANDDGAPDSREHVA